MFCSPLFRPILHLLAVCNNQTPEVKLRSGSSDKPDKDVCRYNWIHSNDFVTYGNECVDIKEGSEQNVVEHNTCQKQRDENSGCMGSRGSNNCFRHNSIDECRGAGVRVGGDKGHGEGNCICNNVISNAKYGAFNIMTSDQGPICGNELSDIDVVVRVSPVMLPSKQHIRTSIHSLGFFPSRH